MGRGASAYFEEETDDADEESGGVRLPAGETRPEGTMGEIVEVGKE